MNETISPARELAALIGDDNARNAIEAGWDAIRRMNAETIEPFVHPGTADYVATVAILAAVEAGLLAEALAEGATDG